MHKKITKIIKDIKRANEKAFILCGGHHCNAFKEYIEGSDLTCIGEAEGYITKILDSLILKKPLNGIPGLIYKKNGQVVKNPGTMKVDDLDLSLPPAWKLINRKNYPIKPSLQKHQKHKILRKRATKFQLTSRKKEKKGRLSLPDY